MNQGVHQVAVSMLLFIFVGGKKGVQDEAF